MSKPKRGNNIKGSQSWRGTCPSCGRVRVRLQWEKVTGTKADGKPNTIMVCKHCGD